MAGSLVQKQSEGDHILSSRLEGLTLLASRLSEPVIIFDLNLQLIYANPEAEKLSTFCPLLTDPASSPQHPTSNLPDSCSICTAREVLRSKECNIASRLHLSSDENNPSCPFGTAFPIAGAKGLPACVVMMGNPPEGSLGWNDTVERRQMIQETCPRSESRLGLSLIGRSALMQQLIDMIELFAQSDSTVLIEGESGTGKELIAKSIHQLSARRDQPFVVVECSSLTETLLESELFGHVRGAFTGAVSDRKGLFEEAEGGTIFLDEIADTPPTFQAKLLRVLQEGEVKLVGSNRSIKINIRVISASNQPLTALVRNQVFRSDLYYRLAVLPVVVPALRERRDDIPLLVQHFLEQSCCKNQRTGVSIPMATMEALVQYDWPGNVRELENVIERAVVIGHRQELSIHDVFGDRPEPTECSDLASISKAARQAVEKQEILKALQDTKGDKTRAARQLKISRANLYNKLKSFQIL